MLGGHIHAVFTLITFIFIICVSYTITSFKEMPLHLLETQATLIDLPPRKSTDRGSSFAERKSIDAEAVGGGYGSINSPVSG